MVKPDAGMKLKMDVKCFADIVRLDRGEKIDERGILPYLDYIDERWDCADFRMVGILKTLCAYSHLLSPETLARIKKTVLNFKYWMDEPGEDGMCYWSENHQCIFAAVEYIAGQLYSGEVFPNSGLSGAQHQAKAEARLSRWLAQRFDYGFTEWHSNTYYEEDIGPLALLADHAADESLACRAAMALDLLFLDVALHLFRRRFGATSGRCYEAQKKDPAKADVNDAIQFAFGTDPNYPYNYERIDSTLLLSKKYRIPQVIREIADYAEPLEVKVSMGLYLREVKGELGPKLEIGNAGLFFWLMEAFTNVESINLTMTMLEKFNMMGNNFVRELRPFRLLRPLGVLPALIRCLNPATQGIAIQRVNSYTYRTADYMLSTAQRYHPGEFGDQQHIWQASLPRDINVFTTHPGAPWFDSAERNFSPSYWVGNGINPHGVQYKNYGFYLYRLDQRRGFLEKQRQLYTHLFFPEKKFDEVYAAGRVLAGRVEGTYIGVIGGGDLVKVNDEEYRQDGVVTAWAAVLSGSGGYNSLEDFVNYLEKANLTYDKNRLAFMDGLNDFTLNYRGDFLVNGQAQPMEYARFETPFVTAPRKPERLEVYCNGSHLLLDFRAPERKIW